MPQKDVGASHFPLIEPGRLSEFRFNEPFSAPVGTPINLFSATLATTFILVDDPGDRVWVNAAVRWFANFTAVGTVTVTFTLLRDGVPILAINQTVFNPVAGAATVSNVFRLQYVDLPLSGLAIPTLTPVVYTLQASTISTTAFTTGPVTLSVAEIEPNRL
ncbi:MAG: hypothetical protein AB1556_08210 [Bacillota bacterium]